VSAPFVMPACLVSHLVSHSVHLAGASRREKEDAKTGKKAFSIDR